MSLTFHRAERVAVGDRITSTELDHLARAYNDRLRSGIADGAERILYYTRNAFLSMVNPSGDVYWPQSHFFYQRQQLDPEHGEWPDGEPGYDNGAAIGSNWPAYVWGSEELDLDDEATRLTDPVQGMPVTPGGGTLRDYWELGKRQRGAWDASTGALASPSFTAARAYAKIRWRWWSPQGASWGGYFPMPTVSATACEDPDTSDSAPAPINYEVFFTNLETAATQTYDGTCQDGPDISTPGMYDTHIYAIGYAPWAYYVVLNDGTVDELPRNLWVEGPYTGEPRLSRAWANHLERFGHRLAGEFRGEEANEQAMRGYSRTKARNAYRLGRLLRQQYLLAPSRGVQSGSEVEAIYRTVALQSGQSEMLAAEAGYVHGAFLCESVQGASVQCVSAAGEVLGSANATAAGALIVPHPAPTECTLRCLSGAVEIEVAELMDYHPGPWDVLMLVRVGAARM